MKNILENAMARDFNREFSLLFEREENWFGILITACTKFITGGDSLSLASDLAYVILKDEKFIALLKASNPKTALFYTGCYLRARDLVKFYRNNAISFSCDRENDFSDILPAVNKDRLELEEVIRSVIENFENNEYLKSVASLRFENGDVNSINHIAERLNVKKGARLFNAIKEIDDLCRKKLAG
jgi:hypothetical protein